MACWNMEVVAKEGGCSPSFKFERQGGGAEEEIRSLQYDRQTYRLLTLTENWVSSYFSLLRYLEYHDWDGD